MKIDRFKVGMRMIKTIISVFLTILVSQALGRQDLFFGVITTVVVMGTTVSGSLQDARERMIGNLFGAVVGYYFAGLPQLEVALIPLGIGLIIYFCNIFKIQNSISISVVIFASIVINYSNAGPLDYAVNRIFDTTIGIAVAIIINLALCPNNYYGNIQEEKSKFLILSEKILQNISEKVDFSEEFKALEESFYRLVDFVRIYNSEIRLSHQNDEKVIRLNVMVPIYRDLMENFKDVIKLTLQQEEQVSEEEYRDLEAVYQYHLAQAKRDFERLQEGRKNQ